MKILVLAPQPFYVERGTPIDVDILLRALCQRGDDVHALTYADGEDRHYCGLHLHRVRSLPLARPRRPGFSLAKLMCDVLMFFHALKLARQIQPDVVHAGEEAVFIAMAIKRLRGTPYVYDMDSSIAQQLVEQRPWLKPLAGLFNAVEARAIRGAIAVAPVCNALADLARQRGAARVITLHDISQLGDDALTHHGAIAAKIGRSTSRPMMMYVGNLEPYQGIDLLLESMAVARSLDASLDLVIAGGDAADIARYEQRSRELGIDDCTHFIGTWSAARLGELLGEADMLVAPRIRGINTPMKIFPYLHSGRAVLVTDLPTHTQILDDSIAMLAAPQPRAFGEAIAQLAGDAALRDRLGRAGRDFAKREHTYEAHQRRVNTLYDIVQRDLNDHVAENEPSCDKQQAVLEKA